MTYVLTDNGRNSYGAVIDSPWREATVTDISHVWSRTTGRRAVIRGVGVGSVGLAGAALIGCGSGPSASTPAGGSSAGGAPGASNAPAADKPQMSEAFVAVQTRDAPSLEPLDSNVYTIPERIGLVYPKLLYSALEDPKDPTSIKWVLSELRAHGPRPIRRLIRSSRHLVSDAKRDCFFSRSWANSGGEP